MCLGAPLALSKQYFNISMQYFVPIAYIIALLPGTTCCGVRIALVWVYFQTNLSYYIVVTYEFIYFIPLYFFIHQRCHGLKYLSFEIIHPQTHSTMYSFTNSFTHSPDIFSLNIVGSWQRGIIVKKMLPGALMTCWKQSRYKLYTHFPIVVRYLNCCEKDILLGG